MMKVWSLLILGLWTVSVQSTQVPGLGPIPVPTSYKPRKYTKGAVVANGLPCAEIGNKILTKYGNAVDAMIATLICDGVICPERMGIGGGFMMTVYVEKERKAYALVARETAPAGASEYMFKGDPKLSQFGGLAVGIPGEIRGYDAAYKKLGGVAPWSELFTDTIELCKAGIPVTKSLRASIIALRDQIANNEEMRKVFLKSNGDVPEIGDNIKMLKLARTLEVIAEEGADAMYNGSLSAGLVEDIQAAGGIITAEDLANYRVRWEEPVSGELGRDGDGERLVAYSLPPPGSGAILLFILKLLTAATNPPLFPSGDSFLDVHRITEAFKYGYGKRTHLADPHFVDLTQVMSELTDEGYMKHVAAMIAGINATHDNPEHYGANFTASEDHGTANLAVLAPNGDAAVATSTINLLFGSVVMSPSTGIILNDQMDDFSSTSITNYFGVKPSPSNRIRPGKRPLSSTCPTVVVNPDTGRARLLIGAAGGTKITTSTALISLWHLYYNMTLKESMDSARFHHQLYPMLWNYETDMSEEMKQWMESLGHETNPLSSEAELMGSVTGIAAIPPVESNSERWAYIEPYVEPRFPGSWAGF